MRVKLFTLPYSAMLGGFDETLSAESICSQWLLGRLRALSVSVVSKE